MLIRLILYKCNSLTDLEPSSPLQVHTRTPLECIIDEKENARDEDDPVPKSSSLANCHGIGELQAIPPVAEEKEPSLDVNWRRN